MASSVATTSKVMLCSLASAGRSAAAVGASSRPAPRVLIGGGAGEGRRSAFAAGASRRWVSSTPSSAISESARRSAEQQQGEGQAEAASAGTTYAPQEAAPSQGQSAVEQEATAKAEQQPSQSAAEAAPSASAGDAEGQAGEERPLSEIELRRVRKATMDHMQTLASTQNRNTTFRPHHARFHPKAAREITLSHLMAANAHVGHHASQTLKAYHPLLLGTRNAVSIIDIEQHTLPALKRVTQVVRKVLANDGIVLFVATGAGQQASVLRACQRLGSNGFHVTTERWIPGTLTNAPKLLAPAIYKSLESAETDVTEAPDTTKLASQTYQPDLVVVLNPRDNANAVKEATEKHIPTIAIVDSNVDPRLVTYAIPGNDDSLRFADLVVGTIARAGEEGLREGQRLRDEADRARRRAQRRNGGAP